MGSDQHFCLRWNNFHSNIAASFEHLRDHEDFVDVTLACEGRSLKAHKIVLSACSPYFKSLLKQNPCQHPIIILRDVAFPDLSALLSFVYQGEVYVSQERLPAFLRTAEMLHIKGLTEQNQQHPSSTAPVTIGPPSCTTVLQATHEQGVLSSKVASVAPCSPRCSPPPSPSKAPLSPPPKKRRAATITPLPSPRTITSTSPPLESTTLAAALTKPQRAELIVTPSSRPPPLPDPPKCIKQEAEDVKEEEAVNLVMEGSSILRHRIQGFQGSPETPNNGRGLYEESSMDEGFIGAEGNDTEEQDKGSPMVIRSPLVGLLPIDGPGLYGGAGTSGSLSHHDSSQGVLPKGPSSSSRPRYAGPRNCPHCGHRYSTIAALKYHVGLRHGVSDRVPCCYCPLWFDIRADLKRHLERAHHEHS